MLLFDPFSLCKYEKEREAKHLENFYHVIEQLLTLNENSQVQTKMINELKRMLSDHNALTEKLQQENAALKEAKKLSAKNRFKD